MKFSAVVAAAAMSCALVAASVNAGQDPTSELANAICAAATPDAVAAALTAVDPSDDLSDEQIAEAFGIATFLGDLGRCANRQAMADAFAVFKKGKDAAVLDLAFAAGRVAAKPDGGTASAEIYQGSFATLGTAGDPPSGQ